MMRLSRKMKDYNNIGGVRDMSRCDKLFNEADVVVEVRVGEASVVKNRHNTKVLIKDEDLDTTEASFSPKPEPLEVGTIIKGTCKCDESKVDWFVVTSMRNLPDETRNTRIKRIKDGCSRWQRTANLNRPVSGFEHEYNLEPQKDLTYSRLKEILE